MKYDTCEKDVKLQSVETNALPSNKTRSLSRQLVISVTVPMFSWRDIHVEHVHGESTGCVRSDSDEDKVCGLS